MADVVDHSVRSLLTLYLARRQLRFATNLILFCLAKLIATIIPAARQELARVPTKPSHSFVGMREVAMEDAKSILDPNYRRYRPNVSTPST